MFSDRDRAGHDPALQRLDARRQARPPPPRPAPPRTSSPTGPNADRPGMCHRSAPGLRIGSRSRRSARCPTRPDVAPPSARFRADNPAPRAGGDKPSWCRPRPGGVSLDFAHAFPSVACGPGRSSRFSRFPHFSGRRRGAVPEPLLSGPLLDQSPSGRRTRHDFRRRSVVLSTRPRLRPLIGPIFPGIGSSGTSKGDRSARRRTAEGTSWPASSPRCVASATDAGLRTSCPKPIGPPRLGPVRACDEATAGRQEKPDYLPSPSLPRAIGDGRNASGGPWEGVGRDERRRRLPGVTTRGRDTRRGDWGRSEGRRWASWFHRVIGSRTNA